MAGQDKVVYGFIAGEVSPDFYGRTDLSKYEFGLSLCRNFFVDFAGGIKIRGGFEFASVMQGGSTRSVLFAGTVDDYELEFSALRIRVVRYGRYILESAKALTDVTDGNLVGLAAHGYINGDLLSVSAAAPFANRYLEVYSAATNTFRLKEVNGPTPEVFGAIAGGSGTMARVYTIATPYLDADISSLRHEQNYERVIITHKLYRPRLLTYIADNNWSIALLSTVASAPSPTGLTLTPSSGGTAGIAFSVSAIVDDVESQGSPYAFTALSVNYADTAGSLKLNWAAVPKAKEYNVYRSLILPIGAEISYAQSVGYLGRAIGPQFTDNNITPDFTKAPPQLFNPFVNAAIIDMDVTTAGTGYTTASAITIADPTGTGYIGHPVVSSTGTLLGVVTTNPGSNYTAPVVSISIGSSGAITAVASELSGNYPALVRSFQQRMLFAATTNDPMRLWATKPNTLNNFDLSQVVNAGDGYSYQLAAREVRPIQHMIDLRQGVLVFTTKNVVLLRAEEGKAVSGVNALAEPQAYKGANSAEPIIIELDVIFAQKNSSVINAMLYTEYTNTFTMQDIALLSKHLFKNQLEIIRWAWQNEPHKLLWGVRSDGVLLSLTYDREQEVFAWAQHTTQGKVLDILILQENGKEILYLTVERYLRNRWVRCRERMVYNEVLEAEDWFGLDSGLQRGLTVGASTLTAAYVTAAETEIDVTFTGAAAALVIGDVLFFGGGRVIVTSEISANLVRCQVDRKPTNLMHVKKTLYPVLAGDWQYTTPTTTLNNLWHLEGQTVSVNADGDGLLAHTVTNGTVTLEHPVAKASVGLQYVAEAKILTPVFPQVISEALPKDILSAHVRLLNTRGLEVGQDEANAFGMKDLSDEDWGDALKLRSDFPEIVLGAPWNKLGGLYLRQRYPLPAHVLSLVESVELGES